MNDDKAERVLLAVQELAIAVRDEGPDAVRRAAQKVLRHAGDPIAAVTIAAAAIDVNAPLDRWWQPAPTAKKCSDCEQAKPLGEFRRDKSRADGLTYICKECFTLKSRPQLVPMSSPAIPTEPDAQPLRMRHAADMTRNERQAAMV